LDEQLSQLRIQSLSRNSCLRRRLSVCAVRQAVILLSLTWAAILMRQFVGREMASIPDYFLSPQEYLTLERKAEFKSEYMDGVVYAMAGASTRHNLIVANLIITLGAQLKGRPCRVYPSDLKVRVPNSKRFFYPDVSVVCGDDEFADAEQDVILNPTLIVEVSSESTAAFDRGKKFLSYQQIGSLQEYLLVSQDEILVEGYARQGNDTWLYTKVTGLDGKLILPSIESELALRDVYDKVT
jgi:Uma2 family endonuclease